MIDTMHILNAAIELFKQDLVVYRNSDSDSSYSRAYNDGARQATERAIKFIEHALSKQDARAN